MNRHLKRLFHRFHRNDRGAVAVMFGLAAIPVFGLTGMAIDYNRASSVRNRMAAASDAAVLVAAKGRANMTLADRQAAADAAFAANFGSDARLLGLTGRLTKLQGNAWRYEASGDYKYQMIGFIPGISSTGRVGVISEANAGDGKLEVALVLDNTGSMASDMSALRRAARDFTNVLFDSSGETGDLRMSVVPYVASVNPGRMNLGMSSIDARGDGQHHAANLRGRWIGFIPDCNNDPFWTPGPGNGGGGNPGPGVGTPGNGAFLQDAFRKFASIGAEILGIKSAAAQVGTYGTPNRTAPFTGQTITLNPPYVPSTRSALLPTGFNRDNWAPCVIRNPDKISNLDLFDGIRTRANGRAQWKGCVEARPEPFDVTDDPPNPNNPNSQFVPYFWPDEPGRSSQGRDLGYVNNYIDDGEMPTGWGSGGEWEWQANLFKYDGANRGANFSENAPNSSGPNMACPDELLRLTSNRNTVLNKIQGLSHWNGGGTISSEGIMWGWRTLSPNQPFADGAAYGTRDNKKVLVLMTDGENTIGGNNVNGPVMSHYNAYGYMRWGRFPSENFQVAQRYLDDRMRLACANAKAKNIQVITILFRVNTTNATNLLRNCASSGNLFFMARDQNDLQRAFAEVAQQIGKIRLTR